MQLGGMGAELTIQHVFELVLRLKQICNFDPATGASSKSNGWRPTWKNSPPAAARRSSSASGSKRSTSLPQRLDTLRPAGVPRPRFRTAARDGVHRTASAATRIASVMLMSYGAGSVGLNLQFASYVFLFDRWWNPAVEDQAINRAHRIGAAGPVTVTRFLTLGTIEERIDEILAQKRELFDAVFASSNSRAVSGLSRDDLFNLFRLQTPHGVISAAA